MSKTDLLIQTALSLPERERIVIGDALLSSLGPSESGHDAEQWKATRDRRFQELETGQVVPLSSKAVQDRVRKKFPNIEN